MVSGLGTTRAFHPRAQCTWWAISFQYSTAHCSRRTSMHACTYGDSRTQYGYQERQSRSTDDAKDRRSRQRVEGRYAALRRRRADLDWVEPRQVGCEVGRKRRSPERDEEGAGGS